MHARAAAPAVLFAAAAAGQEQQPPEPGGIGGQKVPNSAGQLWGASIGHGTLVNRYANSLNLDHPKFGLAFDVNTTYFGVETMTDYVGDPSLLAGRAYVRPFGDTLFLRGWAVGVTFATD